MARLTHIFLIRGEPMVYAGRKADQISLMDPQPDPVISFIPHIKEPRAFQDVPDLLILMQVFVEEGLHLAVINLTHSGWRDGDLIPVVVVAIFCYGVHLGRSLAAGMEDP